MMRKVLEAAKKTNWVCLCVICTVTALLYGIWCCVLPNPTVKLNDPDSGEFVNLKQNYEAALAKIPKSEYKDNDMFTKTGPPIRTILRKDGTERLNKKKTILLWTAHFGNLQWFPPDPCDGRGEKCEVSRDPNDLLKSDAVLMHPIDLKSLPPRRLPNQRWVYFVQVPPYLANMNSEDYNGVFNWTFTYRWDSDVPAPLYNTTPLQKPLADSEYNKILSELLLKKKKTVAIMHSNCHPHSNRFDVVRELRRYIPVDFYGKCGNLSCPENTKDCTEIMSSYKFYLAFEDGRCRNWISNNVGLPLHDWKSVPIVLGAPVEDYARVMPPNSYIHIAGFSSIKKLAEYIQLLDRNAKTYAVYHQWRKTHTEAPTTHFCDLCKALYNDALPVKTYTDFKGWYDQDICFPVENQAGKFLLIGVAICAAIAIAFLNLRRSAHWKRHSKLSVWFCRET